MAADAVAEATAGHGGVGKQRLQLQTSGAQRQTSTLGQGGVGRGLNPPGGCSKVFLKVTRFGPVTLLLR